MEKQKPESSNDSFAFLDRFFELSARGTTVKKEMLAGLTTFMTVSYVIVVIPLILSETGMPKEAALAATIFAIAFSTLLMALWANFPVVTGPGMGLSAFFTYSVVIGEGLSWETALGAVFISGVIFFILTATGIRGKIIDAIPSVLKSSITVGIGLFVAFIGLKNAGIIVGDDSNFVGLGKLASPGPIVALIGVLLSAVFMACKMKGAIILGIILTTLLAMITGVQSLPTHVSDVFTLHLPSVAPTFMKLDIGAAFAYGIFSIVFSFTIVELFDTLATLIGLSRKAGLEDENGKIPNLNRALTADSIGTMASALFGSTALNTYIENATGITEGGRTGLKSLTVAVLFLLTLFLAPLIQFIPTVATAPPLIIIGALMLSDIKNINMEDFTELIPAFLTIVMMPLTFSIADGLAFGFLSYTFLKLLTGRYREIHPFLYIICIAFIINFYMIGH
ncbi:NCS2 family permease [Priestia filamentosa]|uniref:NCS2 family permease n=1 Tax=Priestia filamentosa TaxID=1402861 RepID=UPI003D2D4BB8